MKTIILAAAAAATLIGAVDSASAQPMRPLGWVGPHYFWHGHHYHHRRRWHGGWRYY